MNSADIDVENAFESAGAAPLDMVRCTGGLWV